MVSLITASYHSVVTLNFPVNSERTRQRRRHVVCFNLLLKKESFSSFSFGFVELRRRSDDWCAWCKGWESDGDTALEAEVLEFMKKSKKPEVFPTKKELFSAGRMDLVDAILKNGGWLSMGWHSDDENGEEKDVLNLGDFQRRAESFQESNSFEVAEVGCSGFPSSSGRSLEMATEEDTGIEGIVSRLEKQRNLSFRIKLGKNEDGTSASSKDNRDHTHFGTSTDSDRAELERNCRLVSSSPNKSISINSGGKLSRNGSLNDLNGLKNSVKPEMWRTWSIQRAGFSDTEFEAAEISFNENQMEVRNKESKDEILAVADGATEALDRQKGTNHYQIRTRLQQLELELASALCLLRSKTKEFISKGHESTSCDLQKFSDALEFQENELMNAQDKLRSIRAKLAVLEGKMALAIIHAQKMVEEKHKRIDGAHRALQLIRSACIVWPNSASEVLLAGSFDGWTTQRKMVKSRTGIFSLHLKLYPGRYEIKFIVDGIWRIDPLRPIVLNNGYENNVLVIT